MSTPTERVAEFVRQARRLRDINPDEFHNVWTDPEASEALLSLNDLDALTAEQSSGHRLIIDMGRAPRCLCGWKADYRKQDDPLYVPMGTQSQDHINSKETSNAN